MVESSFPRGGVSHDGGPTAPAATAPAKQKKPLRPSDRKRKRKKEEKGEVVKEDASDFLFGRGANKAEISTAKKRHKRFTDDGDDADELDAEEDVDKLVSKQSMMPLGGGGVVISRSSSKHSKKKEPTIEAISFSRLAKGTKLLGVVREVRDEFAVLSLPNLLTGYMLQVGDRPLTQCLSIGQYLAVSIVKLATEEVKGGQTRRRIQVSAAPTDVNSRDALTSKYKVPIRGCIVSVEDHGCLVDVGFNKRGFVKLSDVQGGYTAVEDDDDQPDVEMDESGSLSNNKKRVLQPGRFYDFFVKQSSVGADVLALTLPSTETLARHSMAPAAKSKKGKKKSNDNVVLPLASFCPGWLIDAKVETLASNGVCVTFWQNSYRGSIEVGHIGAYFAPTTKNASDQEWRKVFMHHRSLTARILAVDVATKTIRLSLQPHVLNFDVPGGLPDVGDVIDECRVVRLDANIGALLSIPSDDDDDDNDDEDDEMDTDTENKKRVTNMDLMLDADYRKASKVKSVYVHISKATDQKDASSSFAKKFAPSTTHKVRILSTLNWVEGIASGACAPSIVSSHVLTYDDLKPGQVYQRVPVSMQFAGGAGILVSLGPDIRGLITPIHLFDSTSNSEFRQRLLKAKYALGAKIDVRVLYVDTEKKKCFLTAKKSLVKAEDENSETEIVTSYDSFKVGQLVAGFVSKVDDKGVYVTFFNRVYGRVTARSLAAELSIENHRDEYRIGDVVRCRVAHIRKTPKSTTPNRSFNKEEEVDSDDDVEPEYFWEILLSMQLDGVKNSSKEDVQKIASKISSDDLKLRAGAVLPSKSMKIVELIPSRTKLNGGIVPGFAIVTIKSKHLTDNQEALSVVPYIEAKLPFDQLVDSYSSKDLESAESMDAMAMRLLKVGKKINQKGIILTDPHKSAVEYLSGIGKLTIVSIRKILVEKAESQETSENDGSSEAILPSVNTPLFVGAQLVGFVAQVDPRYGSFVRFLGDLTGLVPKTKSGLNLSMYSTVTVSVVAVDHDVSPPKVLLKYHSSSDGDGLSKQSSQPFVGDATKCIVQRGDQIDAVEVLDVNFSSCQVKLLDDGLQDAKAKVYIHSSLKDAPLSTIKPSKKSLSSDDSEQKIVKGHPFYKWKAGKKIEGLYVAAVTVTRKGTYIQLTDVMSTEPANSPVEYYRTSEELSVGTDVAGIVTGVANDNRGIYLQVSPNVNGFIPALEVSTNPKVLNNLKACVRVGSRMKCRVTDSNKWASVHAKVPGGHSQHQPSNLHFSILELEEGGFKPIRGDVVAGRINPRYTPVSPPSLMIDLRGGFVGRCCITELEEADEWNNMPLGRQLVKPMAKKRSDADADGESHDDILGDKTGEEETDSPDFPNGKFIACRIMDVIPSISVVDVSLRSSRLEGDLDDDEAPEEDAIVQGYVVSTNPKGCFVRIARHIQGRCILKELSDGFIPNPEASFPPGRLVTAKLKGAPKSTKKSKSSKSFNPIKKMVDLDMRESVVLESAKKLDFDDIEIGSKHKATVTRIESYGVFVRIEESNVSGLVHKSECSDDFIKSLESLYDPGDLVKVVVVKKDDAEKRVGFSMKASHFADDPDSDDDSSVEDMDSDDDGDGIMDVNSDSEADSDDENFGAKLAAKMMADGEVNSDEESSNGDEDSDESDSDESENDDEDRKAGKVGLGADVGFDWGNQDCTSQMAKADSDGSDSDSDDSPDEEDDGEKAGRKNSHSSRKNQARRRREEQEIARREGALADGTADENLETAADFERVIAGDPNSSENWMKYMAFHLALADVAAARKVADRAFERIEFQREEEKLNVWTALLTLELSYGDGDTFKSTIDRACKQNNPKRVYLRVCEILEKKAEQSKSPDDVSRADELFAKMCKKFKTKKTVWIAHLQYLLKMGREDEAHELSKRSLLSLPPYKHTELMSRYAQLEFEFGSPERARTIFGGILTKYPKRLDLLNIYLDKEIKFGEIKMARAALEERANPDSEKKTKLSSKQAKSLFKKWYRIEEEHGTDEDREHVKELARAFVESQ